MTPIEVDTCVDYLDNLLGPAFCLAVVGARRRGSHQCAFVDVLLLRTPAFGKNGSSAGVVEGIADRGVRLQDEHAEEYIVGLEDLSAGDAKGVLEEALQQLFNQSHEGARRAIATIRFGTSKVLYDIKAVIPKEYVPALLHFTGPDEFVIRMRKLATRSGHLLLPWAVVLAKPGLTAPEVGNKQRQSDEIGDGDEEEVLDEGRGGNLAGQPFKPLRESGGEALEVPREPTSAERTPIGVVRVLKSERELFEDVLMLQSSEALYLLRRHYGNEVVSALPFEDAEDDAFWGTAVPPPHERW
ncbi:hypothetical protein HDU96_008030 [Phlyctochytrium bullatum]|nr:hypothetical protein HDU96_008030 [Phlyctochytrium bullatum]